MSPSFDPKLQEGDVPVWWNPEEGRMWVDEFIEDTPSCLIVSRHKRLKITQELALGHVFYRIEWHITGAHKETAQGNMLFLPSQLEAAFGFSDLMGWCGGHLSTKYGATSASVGRYIRWRDFLNMPGPGIGREFDTNISLRITPEIAAVVERMLHRILFYEI